MSLLFVSDLHLDENQPKIFKSLEWFIEEKARGQEALYILGDLFETWIGDDYSSPLISQTIQLLKYLTTQGTDVFFMHGNRDFLVGDLFASKANCTLLPDIHKLTINHQTVLLCHGDSLCTMDHQYMAFRKLARDPNWQHMMLAKPIEERLQMANLLRQASQSSNQQKKSSSIMDVTPSEVVKLMETHQADVLIHGHTHRPDIHTVKTINGDAKRIVLGDWDLAGWMLSYQENSFQLLNFPLQN